MQIKNTTQRKAALQEVENIINQYGWSRMPQFEKAIVDEKQKAIYEFDKDPTIRLKELAKKELQLEKQLIEINQ